MTRDFSVLRWRMDSYKEIKSVEDLFAYVNELEQGAKFLPIKLAGRISLALHIEGPSWDGRIDKRTAQYVVDLQKALEHMLEEYAPEAVPQEILVKVETKEGSWQSLADVTSFLEVLAGKMTDEQSFCLFMTALLLVGGYMIFKRHTERKENVEIEQERTKQEIERNKTLQSTFHVLEKRAGSSPETMGAYERPVRSLIRTMEDNDSIIIGQTAEKIPAEEAKKYASRRAPRSEEAVTYADGNYTVNAICYDEGEIVLELEQGGQVIKAYLWQFDENDRRIFRESLNRHEQEDALPFSMDLQLNVVHTQRRLKHAVVIGEGAPREGKSCVPLRKIVARLPR